MRLQGKVALITGGTSGIGLATAHLFHAEGARVYVTGANPARLEAARAAMKGIATVIGSDAGSLTDITATFAQIEREAGALDILFLNAGVVGSLPIADLDEAKFDELMRINVKGPMFALKAAIPLLRTGGAVVLNGSINAHIGMPGTAVYTATKGALIAFARVAANELVERGVRVNVLSPGPTDSGIIDKAYSESASAIKQHLATRIPMRRMGTVDEIARAALFLASDDSSFMTGEEIVVDGGMTRV
jgi:NAD(P)-dependent dehydrogenase (short-subunit alcohol dehydrogenase family)